MRNPDGMSGLTPKGMIKNPPLGGFFIGKMKLMTTDRVQAALEKRGQIIEQMMELSEAHPEGFDTTTQAKYDRLNSEQEKAKELGERFANEEALNYEMEQPFEDGRPLNRIPIGTGTIEDRGTPIVKKGESFAEKVVARHGRPLGVSNNVSLGGLMHGMLGGPVTHDVRAALTEGTDSQGGYTVPTHLTAGFIDALRQKTAVFEAGANVMPLETQTTNIARLDTDPSWAWRAEGASVTESTPSFSNVTLVPKSLAVLVKASNEVLQDSVNIEQILFQSLVNSAAVAIDNAVLTGSGSGNEPLGILNTSGIANVDMGTNGDQMSDFAPLIDAYYQVQKENANDPTAAVMHPRTFKDLARMTEDSGQPLIMADMIKDLPLLTTTGMPIDETKGTSTDASSVLVGDFSQVIVGIRQDFQLEVLRELYRSTLETGFIAHLRVDVAVTRPQHFCRIEGVTTY